jgi:PAS domain S-box-containing protein
MKAVPFLERFGFALAGCSVGLVLTWLTNEPIGYFAAVAAVFVLVMSVGGILVGRERKKTSGGDAERALHIIESMPAYAWSADPNGKFTYVSPNVLAFTGHPAQDLDPVDSDEFGWRQVVHPDDYDRVADRWRHCLRTGDHYDCEHRIRRSDGLYRWFRNSGSPERDRDGRITGWYGTTIDVDEQKKAEAALRASERSLQQLIDTVPVLIWCLSPDGNPTYFNKRMVEYTGVSIEQLGPPNADRFDAVVKALMHPDDAIAVTNAVQRAVMTGEAFSLKHRLRRSDGVHRWVEARAEPMRDAEGAIVQWYGLYFDIDGQMHAEEALRQSEQQLQQLVDTVPVQIWCVTPTGEPAYINKTMMDYIGMKLEDFEAEGGLRSAVQTIVHPDDRDALFGALSHSFRTGEPFALRFRNRRGDDVYRWTEGRADPLRDDSGQIIQWYGVNVDIDDLLATQEALRERERFLWQLVETLPAMIDCAAPDGEPIYRSQRLREFLGYQLEELDEVGKSRLTGTLDAGVHPDDLAGVKEKYAHSLSTGEPYARRHRLRRFDGEYRWVETRAGAMRNAEGAIVQWNVICLDIDGEVRTQEELRLAQERLARANQAASLAELSASIAHEVNQPLAAVVANSHACQRWLTAEPPNIERAHRAVERIIRDANGAADVVSRIRALFRQSLETRGSTALGSVIAEVRGLMTEEAARRSVRMDVEVESGLPPVTVDRVQVQQVLINLIRNGMEAMDALAGDRVLRVRVRRAAEVVQTEISDCGQGVERPDRIFEPFFTTKEHGMGMGLAICRSVIEAHGGKLWAEKNEPPGATFIFTLPLETKAAP